MSAPPPDASPPDAPQPDAALCHWHPRQPAVAACAECGLLVCPGCRRITPEGTSQCIGCQRPKAAQSAAPDPRESPTVEVKVTLSHARPIPWEQPDSVGDLVAFQRSVFSALRAPTAFMTRIPWVRGDLRTPLLFAIGCGAIAAVAIIIQMLFAPSATVPGTRLPLAAAMLLLAPAIPLLITAQVFLQAGLGHLLFNLFDRDNQQPFEATFRLYAYSQVALIAWWVPFIGSYLETFYTVFLLLSGARTTRGRRFGIGLLALLPVLLGRALIPMAG